MIDTEISDTNQHPPPKSWRSVLDIHPACLEYPELGVAELAELGADIKAHGLQVNIVLIEEGGKELLLDGISRLDAIESAGINLIEDGKLDRTLGLGAGPRVRVVKDVDPYELALSLNLRRRHLNREERAAIIAKIIARSPEKSDRQFAKAIGVDHHTIARARAKGEDVGRIPHVETRTDTKGRKQPATKRPPKPAIPKTNGAEPPPLNQAIAFTPAVNAAGKSMTAAVFPPARGDVGSRSSGEVARLEALVEELQNKNRMHEGKIIGLESELEESKAAPKPADAFAVLLSMAKAGADAATLTADPPDLCVVADWLVKATTTLAKTTKLSEAAATS
jgi:hypothetical protein